MNGLHLYIAFTDPMATKALHICLTFTHSLPHSYTDGGVSHARCHPARREQLGLSVLLMDTLTLGQVEQGIEPPTFWFVDNLNIEPLPPHHGSTDLSWHAASCTLLGVLD